jgi:predicted lipid-binding transport protein (Tim44 family)
MIAAIGSRGVRSRSAPIRPLPEIPVPPAPVPVVVVPVPPVPVTRRFGPWIGPLLGFGVGWLISVLLFGAVGLEGRGMRLAGWVLGGLVLLLVMIRRRRLALARSAGAARDVRSVVETPPVAVTPAGPPGESGLDRGVRDIRRTDPGFDPTRFSGYAGMMFRDAQAAWMTRDIASLRQRVTPEMYGELEAQCDRLRTDRRSNRVEAIEIRAEITEAWQESGRDYVTAYITGSRIDYTVDDVSDGLVEGSRTIPRAVEEFWTFTRPAGLNFWMLSAIQTS